jgi:hypothetical protein
MSDQQSKPDDSIIEMIWNPAAESWSEFDERVMASVPAGRWFRVSTVDGRTENGCHQSPSSVT